ncbi:MAG: hypothetical protein KGZ39_07395 [Simkania sp.]|nr:hypothetical protein [Simkania sp.]
MRKVFSVGAFMAMAALAADSPYAHAPRDYHSPRSLPDSNFISTIDIAKLQAKFSEATPEWMMNRLQKEFSPFSSKKITQKALNETFAQFARCVGGHGCSRYRIIEGKIYRYGPDPFGMDAFFRTIGRLADYPGIPDLPNVDFIINHNDGTPFDFQPRDFWITEDFQDQAPILTYARKKDAPYLISIPDRFTIPEWAALSQQIIGALSQWPWEIKYKSAFWRGQPNDFARLGMSQSSYAETALRYSEMPRYKICSLSSLYPTFVDAGFSSPGFSATSELIAFIQPFNRPGIYQSQHLRWAYLPVLDGYTSTYPGFLWRLLSNSVAFKQESEDSQWFYDALEPYVHYVPISNQMEDLIEKIQWAQEHDVECKHIAENANAFVRKYLMIEDVYFYFFRVLQEYAQNQDCDAKQLYEETRKSERAKKRRLARKIPKWVRIR